MVVSKLAAIRDTLGKYKPAELGKIPTRAFAEDYNRAHAIALKEKPDIAEFAPPALQIEEPQGMMVGPWISGSYLDVLTYSDQLIRLLRTKN